MSSHKIGTDMKTSSHTLFGTQVMVLFLYHVSITNVHCCYDHGHTQGSSAYPMHTNGNPSNSGYPGLEEAVTSCLLLGGRCFPCRLLVEKTHRRTLAMSGTAAAECDAGGP
jgi:hypothetical protein